MLKNFKLFLALLGLSVLAFQTNSCGSDDDEIPTDDGVTDCPDPAKLTPPIIREVVEGHKVLYVNCTGLTGDFFEIEATPEPKQAKHFNAKTITVRGAGTPIRIDGLEDGILYNVRAKTVISCTGPHFSEWVDAPEYKLCTDSPAWSNLNRAALLEEVNIARSISRTCSGTAINAPTTPLKWNYLLEEAAMIHNQDMVKNNFFAHDSPTDGSSPQDRTGRVGYGTFTGENIARGNPQEMIIDQWLNSPPHCTNIMNEKWIDLGLAGDLNAKVYTQNFGVR